MAVAQEKGLRLSPVNLIAVACLIETLSMLTLSTFPSLVPVFQGVRHRTPTVQNWLTPMEAMLAAKWLGVTSNYEAAIAVLRQAEGANQRSRNSLISNAPAARKTLTTDRACLSLSLYFIWRMYALR